jgi:hypothetical protein
MSVKLYVFDSVSEAREFERPATAEAVRPEVKVEAAKQPEAAAAERPVRHYKRKAKKGKKAFKERILKKARASKGFGVGSQPRKCKRCGEPGHRSDTCPKNAGETPDIEPGSGRKQYKPKLSGPELVAAIQGLKEEEGLDAMEIAHRLKVPYSTVVDNWG